MSTVKQHSPQNEPTRGTVFVARLFWFFFGPIALFLVAAFIVQSGTGWATPLDAAFLVIAGLVVLARWYELRSGEGRDGYGRPVTLAQFPKYAGWAVPTAIAAWVAANLLGNHILR